MNGDLDISSKNLSDMHANEIAKCIKMYSGHVKKLNLSKNRISDEGFIHIVKALCESGIEILNMSGNKLTEKCIESVVGSLKTHKVLK
jgi:Leucine Rich repeat